MWFKKEYETRGYEIQISTNVDRGNFLGEMNRFYCFSAILRKGDNFRDFLFAFLCTWSIWKLGLFCE